MEPGHEDREYRFVKTLAFFSPTGLNGARS